MISKNKINTSGVTTLKGSNTQEDCSLLYLPLLQIKTDKVALSDLLINAEIIVRWLSGGENYFNKFFIKCGLIGGEPVLTFKKIGDPEGVGIKACFIKTPDDNYILYAKGGNSAIDINAQVVYCNIPNAISEPYGLNNINVSDISAYDPIYPTKFKTLTATPGSGWYLAENDYHQLLKVNESGLCVINASFYKNSAISSSETVATLNYKPYDRNLQVILQYTKIGETSTNGTCRGVITPSGELKIMKDIEYGCHITLFTIYQSINNSI